ncbi:MAG: hypothetical protein RSD22_04905 [Romboutsia sp.]
MKKNKTIAYMLAATLLVGGTFAGTKALFTDKVDIANKLVITTGIVDIEIKEDTEWFKNGDKLSKDFSTLVPGDVLTREVKVANNSNTECEIDVVDYKGSLDDKGYEVLRNAVDDGFIALSDQGPGEIEKLKNGQSTTLKFEVRVGSGNNDIDNNYQNKELNLSNFLANYEVNISQATKK